MKYYGIKQAERREDFRYWYAKNVAKLKTIIPGKQKKYWKRDYEFKFQDQSLFRLFDNKIPEDHYVQLFQFTTSDLILREDISQLKHGLNWLLMHQRPGDRFHALPIDTPEDVSRKIDEMDSDMMSWTSWIECGRFDFRGNELQNSIDYFDVCIQSINSSYLNIIFRVYLTEDKRKELENLINCQYNDERGRARKYLSSGKHGRSVELYTVARYNNEAIKSRKISDYISCIQWEFYNVLNRHFPFVLHKRGIRQPRIDTFFTDIDYHEEHRWFWTSLGIEDWRGQFIDELQKMFFPNSGAVSDQLKDRLIYVVRDEEVTDDRLPSMMDIAYFHIQEFSGEYFRFLFFYILSSEMGKMLINYKHRLERIKLKKCGLKNLLKLRYSFEKSVDIYERYIRDDLWQKSKDHIGEVYFDSETAFAKVKHPHFIGYKDFCDGVLAEKKRINQRLSEIRADFESKGRVLQSLADYKYSRRNLRVSIVMLFIAGTTLLFVVFPEWAKWLAEKIREIYQLVMGGHISGA